MYVRTRKQVTRNRLARNYYTLCNLFRSNRAKRDVQASYICFKPMSAFLEGWARRIDWVCPRRTISTFMIRQRAREGERTMSSYCNIHLNLKICRMKSAQVNVISKYNRNDRLESRETDARWSLVTVRFTRISGAIVHTSRRDVSKSGGNLIHRVEANKWQKIEHLDCRT